MLAAQERIRGEDIVEAGIVKRGCGGGERGWGSVRALLQWLGVHDGHKWLLSNAMWIDPSSVDGATGCFLGR